MVAFLRVTTDSCSLPSGGIILRRHTERGHRWHERHPEAMCGEKVRYRENALNTLVAQGMLLQKQQEEHQEEIFSRARRGDSGQL